MRVLYDFISFQDSYINGGALYAQAVLQGLLNRGVTVVGLCDAKKPFDEELRRYSHEKGIELVDWNEASVAELCARNRIDVLYLAIAQRFNPFELTDVACRIVCVLHDIGDLVLSNAGVYDLESNHEFLRHHSLRRSSKAGWLKSLYRKLRYGYVEYSVKYATNPKARDEFDSDPYKEEFGYRRFDQLIRKANVQVITVSDYSRDAIEYYFPQLANPVRVFWAPQKAPPLLTDHPSPQVSAFLARSPRYLLVLNTDRYNKNAYLFMRQWERLRAACGPHLEVVCVGNLKIEVAGVTTFARVSNEDLERLYSQAAAFVYPTLNEGFGYPPLEAMRHGTPVLASFATSVPEVLGDAVSYFNPFYEEDLFRKARELLKNPSPWREKAKLRYEEVSVRQNADLSAQLDYLLALAAP